MIKTSAELKQLYERNYPNGRFFDRKTMRFFGDTMSNFGVRDGGKVKALSDSCDIEEVEVWELYRRRPVKSGLHGHCCFFRKSDGCEVHHTY